MADEKKSLPKPQRSEGPTPNGGAYAIAYTNTDGSMEIVEFDKNDKEIMRTYGKPPGRSKRDAQVRSGRRS